jgi:pyrimidine-specific ribonucleoside hydrolase
VLTYLGKEVPVAAGAAHPLMRPLMTAPNVHGETGLDGPVFPEKILAPLPLSALDLQIKVLEESPVPVTIVSVGPQTNVAKLILARPDLLCKIDHVTIMGGAVLGGNWSAAAEFNIMVDPEAAAVLFKSGLPVVMNGLDVTHKAYLTEEDIERFRDIKTVGGKLAAELIDFFKLYHQAGAVGIPLHDPCAVAYELRPDLFETVECTLDTECASEFCDGTIIANMWPWDAPHPHKAVMGIDRQGFIDLLAAAFERYPTEVPV